jgi:hypothetical protein
MGESYLCILSGNKSIHVLSYFFLTCAFWTIFAKCSNIQCAATIPGCALSALGGRFDEQISSQIWMKTRKLGDETDNHRFRQAWYPIDRASRWMAISCQCGLQKVCASK